MNESKDRRIDHAHVVDIHVGARVRARRKMSGISQQDLANRLGLTFQQVQKYERGSNRISASKLFEIAQALKTPVAWFFEGLITQDATCRDGASEDVHAFLATTAAIDLSDAFLAIQSQAQRNCMLNLMRAMGRE